MKVYVLLAGFEAKPIRVCAKKSFATEAVKNGDADYFEEFYLEGFSEDFDPDEEEEEEMDPGLTPYSVDITKYGDIYAYGVLGLALFDRHARLSVQNIVNEAGESLIVGTYRLWAVDEKQAVEYAKARWAKDIESGEWDEEERIMQALEIYDDFRE